MVYLTCKPQLKLSTEVSWSHAVSCLKYDELFLSSHLILSCVSSIYFLLFLLSHSTFILLLHQICCSLPPVFIFFSCLWLVPFFICLVSLTLQLLQCLLVINGTVTPCHSFKIGEFSCDKQRSLTGAQCEICDGFIYSYAILTKIVFQENKDVPHIL